MGERITQPRNDLSELAMQLKRKFGVSVDPNLLKTALSRYDLRSPHLKSHRTHINNYIVNKELERHGDAVLRSTVNAWYEQLHKRHPTVDASIKELLNSNTFLTGIALRSGFTKYVMLNPGTARSNLDETIRQTGGSTTEAVIGAVDISSRRGLSGPRSFFSFLTGLMSTMQGSMSEKFIDRAIFKDPMVCEFLIPFYDRQLTVEQRAQLVSRHLKGARLQVREAQRRRGYITTLTLADGTSLTSNRLRSEVKASTSAFRKMVNKRPWILWGAEGDVRIYYPNMNRR